MSHMACKDHGRRVVCVKNNTVWVHRNGDGSKCDSFWMQSGKNIFSRDFKQSTLDHNIAEFVTIINRIVDREAQLRGLVP